MGILPSPVCLFSMCVHCPWRTEEGVRTGVTGGYKLLYGCWEQSLGPLEEQPVAMTVELSASLAPSVGLLEKWRTCSLYI